MGFGVNTADITAVNTWLANQVYPNNIKLLFGTGLNASILYDGTDIILDPKEVGSGRFKVQGGLTLPQVDDAATPTLAFGDGDSGFYESADDTVVFASGGIARFQFNGAFLRSVNSSGPGFVNEAASDTNPTLLPDTSDVDTGIGQAAADQLSLITGGVERIRLAADGAVGIGAAIPARRLQLEQDDALNSAVTQLIRLTHTTSGAPVIGIGVGMEFEVETAAGNNEIGALIEAVTIDVGAGTEDFDLVFRTMAAGAPAAERMRLKSTGALDFGGAGSITKVGAAGNSWTANLMAIINANDGGVNEFAVSNTSDVASSNARLRASVGGAGAQDPYISLVVNGVVAWGLGIDNSNGDVFVITTDGSNGQPGGNDALRITVATPPVISYNTSHPTGTYDYVCDACGRHEGEMFQCCGKVEWQDDVTLGVQAIRGEKWAIDQMSKIGVMERTMDNDGNPQVFTRLGMDVAFAWAMAGQNRQLIDRRYDELGIVMKEQYEELDRRLREIGV